MSLDTIIPPEIVDCKLAHALTRLAARPDIHTIIEIGSSSGDGSTAAIVKGMRENPSNPTLHCIEMSRVRHNALCDRYGFRTDMHKWLGCTVGIDGFMTPEQVTRFYLETPTNLNHYQLTHVLAWLKQDLDYMKHLPQEAETKILERLLALKFNKDKTSMMVFIDGSAFTAKAEMNLVSGARLIILDDTNDIKNYDNYHRLSSDPNYQMIEEDPHLRNGYAIFERV